MELIEVAEKYRLKFQKIEGELVIAGRQVKRNHDRYPTPDAYGLDSLLGHIFEYNATRLGLVVIPRRPRVWRNLSRKLLAAGFEIRQNGDWEGVATFDPAKPAQVRLAIKAIGARKKRRASEAQLRNLGTLRRLITPPKPPIEPPSTAPGSFESPGGYKSAWPNSIWVVDRLSIEKTGQGLGQRNWRLFVPRIEPHGLLTTPTRSTNREFGVPVRISPFTKKSYHGKAPFRALDHQKCVRSPMYERA